MRYVVKARIKEGRERALLQAIKDRSLGEGSVAGDEYQRNMSEARRLEDGTVQWVEVCFCQTPLQEERPYWEAFFDLASVQDAHNRKNCRDLNGTEPWACCDCDCTKKLEASLAAEGIPFLASLRRSSKSPGTTS